MMPKVTQQEGQVLEGTCLAQRWCPMRAVSQRWGGTGPLIARQPEWPAC